MRQRANYSSLNASTILKQSDKDKIAIQNTKKAIQDRQEIKRHYQRWIPQSINNQNALFSQVPQKHKPMKKQNKVATISINIFELPSDFKPCVKRTDLSTRNSHLFTENQSLQNWKSTSKRVGEVNNSSSRQISPKRHVKIAQLHNGKKTTIDLSWGTQSVNLNRQKGNSRMYKSYYNKLNSSSIKF